jgi:hypothetical protein
MNWKTQILNSTPQWRKLLRYFICQMVSRKILLLLMINVKKQAKVHIPFCLGDRNLTFWSTVVTNVWGELISLWLCKENKLWDWKNVFTLHTPPELHTHTHTHTNTRLHCTNFFNPFMKNFFGCAANRKSQRHISTHTIILKPLHFALHTMYLHVSYHLTLNSINELAYVIEITLSCVR